MEVQNIAGWSIGLMILSIVVAGVAPSATTILFAMTFIGISMIILVLGILLDKSPAIQTKGIEKNYGPGLDQDDTPPY